MGLLDRLGPDVDEDVEEKISIEGFLAGLAEYGRGAVTKKWMENKFGLSKAELSEMDGWATAHSTGGKDRGKIRDVLTLYEQGHYNKGRVIQEIGIPNPDGGAGPTPAGGGSL